MIILSLTINLMIVFKTLEKIGGYESKLSDITKFIIALIVNIINKIIVTYIIDDGSNIINIVITLTVIATTLKIIYKINKVEIMSSLLILVATCLISDTITSVIVLRLINTSEGVKIVIGTVINTCIFITLAYLFRDYIKNIYKKIIDISLKNKYLKNYMRIHNILIIVVPLITISGIGIMYFRIYSGEDVSNTGIINISFFIIAYTIYI